MISVGKLGSASEAASYYAKDNYYTADQQQGGSAWAGKAAEALGLSGPVDAAAFEGILRGTLPDGSTLSAKRGEHRAGWDVTMSVSKSVSLVALLGGDAQLVHAVRAASLATLAWVERNIAEARIWTGKHQEAGRTGNLLAATFLHNVNRCNEPQLHVHAVIANATKASDGKWHALHPDELYNRQRVIGAVFNAALRDKVERLGYATTPARNPTCGAFEIVGVSRTAIEAFSTRSAQVDAYLAKHGLQGSPREREIAVLATRDPKVIELAPERRAEGWTALAVRHGLDVKTLVGAAHARAARGETIWSRAMTGVRGVGAKGATVLARMGLSPRDGDPLVPERLGRLAPHAYATAQAVASAVRDLGQREAAFDRLDLIRTALERGGPITVTDVEQRLALLEEKRLLVTGDTRLLTTAMARRAETQVLAMMLDGKGRVAPVVPTELAGERAQRVARELGLRPLNVAQERAAALILSSADRIVLVQGVSGAGKSAVLQPVVRIAQAEGRPILGLAIAGTIAAKLEQDTDAPTSTIAGFITRHRGVIDGTASPGKLADARATLRGGLLLIDEASQIGTAQMSELLSIAQRLDVGRVALIGDARQTGAVDAGKPFAQAQGHGIAMAELPNNLRARSPIMKATAAALNAGDVTRAFDLLRPVTMEVRRVHVPIVAAELWANLPREERDATLLLASGRAMRTAANAAAQAERTTLGEIAGPVTTLQMLDRITITREGARQDHAYRPGHVVEFLTALPSQGMARGDRGTVVSMEPGRVMLGMSDGSQRSFVPSRLPRNLRSDAVSVYALKDIVLHAGDRIRWTANDPDRGLLNAQLARVEEVGARAITVTSLADGKQQVLERGDRMLERLDLAYALNVHTAQGVTTDHGIVMMSAREGALASQSTFLVAVTRIADKATLVVDNGRDLQRTVLLNPGEKTAALDVAKRYPGTELTLDEPSGGRRRGLDMGMEM